MTLMNKIWKDGNIPEKWNRGLICPVFKKGDKEKKLQGDNVNGHI